MKSWSLAMLAFLLGGSAVAASADPATPMECPAYVQGLVSDGQGQPVPGVDVQASFKADVSVVRAVTLADGRFHLCLPRPGRLSLEFSLFGFKQAKVKIEACEGQTVSLTQVLEVEHVQYVICDLLPHVPIVRRQSETSTKLTREFFNYLPGQ